MQKHPLSILLGAAVMFMPLTASAAGNLPKSIKIDKGPIETVCSQSMPEWRNAQTIEGVKIQESLRCNPDNPSQIAAEVKGTNNVSMETLMNTYYAADAIIKKNDMDGDGDPDLIIIKLEVAELNGHSPDFDGLVPTFDIAPGIQPAMWVFAPKSRGMATNSFVGVDNPNLALISLFGHYFSRCRNPITNQNHFHFCHIRGLKSIESLILFPNQY